MRSSDRCGRRVHHFQRVGHLGIPPLGSLTRCEACHFPSYVAWRMQPMSSPLGSRSGTARLSRTAAGRLLTSVVATPTVATVAPASPGFGDVDLEADGGPILAIVDRGIVERLGEFRFHHELQRSVGEHEVLRPLILLQFEPPTVDTSVGAADNRYPHPGGCILRVDDIRQLLS